MKILQIIPHFYPAWAYGGPTRNVYGLAKELIKRGHSVTVYTTDALNSKERIKRKEEVVDGIKIRRFKNLSNTLAYNHNIFFEPSMLLEARKEVSSFNIIHMHAYRTIQNIIVHHYAKKRGVPYVLQARGSVLPIFQKQWLKKIFDATWGYRILKDAAQVIALTKTEAEQYKSRGVNEDKIEIIPNGIDPSEFDNLPKKGEFRRKYGLGDDQKIILYLGRIHKIKGLDLLAKAFTELPKEIDNVKLVIAGPDDGYLSALRRLIKELHIEEKVLFTGPLYEEEKLEAYVDADIYVLPSSYEIFGITILEACACGTPVVVTDRCGIAESVDGQAGLVVPYDKEQLQHALLHMLGDDKMRLQFGEKGKLLVRQKFNWEKMAEQMEKVYQGVTQV